MTTVLNTRSEDTGTGATFVMGVFLLLAIFLLLYFGIPAMRGGMGGGGTSVNIPETMDVNVNTPPQQ